MQCLKTARQASYQFCKKNGFHEHKEVLAEAQLAMCEAQLTYKEDRERKKESWIAYVIHQELNKKFKNSSEFVELEEELTSKSTTDPERLLIMNETLNSFSKAAKEAVELIFTGEIESLGKNAAKKEIKQVLRNKGYSWDKIQNGFAELRSFANSLE